MPTVLRLAVLAAAAAAALAPVPASWIESAYSERLYLAIQRVVTPLSNRVPFALFDGLVAIPLVWIVFVLAGTVRNWRHGSRVRSLVRAAVRAATAVAVIYLVFLLMWGLNYRRVPLSARLAFNARNATTASAARLARLVVGRLNELSAALGPEAGPSWDEVPRVLAPSFARVQGQLAHVDPAVPGRPKASLLSVYFQLAGVDGMTNPFLLEVVPNRQLLPVERLSVTAHEWAHLAGYADESEAGLVGWLICLQGPPEAQYSAHLQLAWHLMVALPSHERSAAFRPLREGPRGDLKAMSVRMARSRPGVRRLAWWVYDRYLKANRVDAGVASYGAALGLLLGTELTDGWVPASTVR